MNIILVGLPDQTYKRTPCIQLKSDMDLDVVSRVNPWNFHFHPGKFSGQPHGKGEGLAFFTMHHKTFRGSGVIART